MSPSPTILCLASYFKGSLFLEECHRQGCHVIVITEQKLSEEAWPRAVIDEFYLMPDLAQQPDITHAVSFLARTRSIDCIVALDDYDVETAAALREHLRLPGLGISAAKLFRDKLAMRVRAHEAQIRVPEFVHLLNHERVADFMARVSPPWVLKPRSEAGSMGIKKVYHSDEVWAQIEQLGDRQSYFLLEQFVAGDVYHVDSLVWNGEIVFAAAHRYGLPPMTVYQGGGVFVTSTLPYASQERQEVVEINRAVLRAMGMQHGVTHAEFIRSQVDGRFYFLEIAARVGGANVDMLVEQATGVNPWVEWARLEIAQLRGETYAPPQARQEYAGLLVSLARQEWPDSSGFDDPEIVWRLHKRHHIGFVVRSPAHERVQSLITSYIPRIGAEYMAVEAPLDKPPD
ncbi:MAG: ATP-grasp domain-containing protein [Caldilineaceae bacterium]|nr:ATP-grasp domain-containing protein [Caldilineaceae bacterium]